MSVYENGEKIGLTIGDLCKAEIRIGEIKKEDFEATMSLVRPVEVLIRENLISIQNMKTWSTSHTKNFSWWEVA